MEDVVALEAQATILQTVADSSFAPVASVVVACIFFGGFGGLVALWSSSEDEKVAAAKGSITRRAGAKSAAIGIGGAIGFMFFTLAVGGITEAVVS